MEAFLEEFQHLKIQLEEIKSATGDFNSSKIIGKGGFGVVHEGVLSHSKKQNTVAFKRLDRRHGQGDPEFWKEILMLSRYTHKNLISLLGFCDQDGEKIIVYEYASNGSLDRHLSSTSLTWKQRLKICLGAAMGLCYLHDPNETQQRVIHRDIKSSNILLDENWNAKISDMGLSKIGPANQQHTFLVSNVVGTFGYVDPMYVEMSILTKESDVYSFGVVLFEVLCGRLCFENNNNHFQNLVPMWKKSFKQKKLDEIIFQDLKQHMDTRSLEVFSDTAYQCLQKSRTKRPKMFDVVEKLEIALGFQEEFEETESGIRKVRRRHNDTKLHLAAQHGDLAAVKRILNDTNLSSLVNEVNELGETVIYTASERGYVEVVKELLKYSDTTTILRKSRSMFDPLHVAASQGHHGVVQVLLDHDASLCCTTSRRNATPLITAASKGHTAVVHLLLLTDPSLIHIVKSDGKNALHLGVASGSFETVKTLLEKNQEMGRRKDKKGQTALHMAAKGTSSEIVKLLFEADPVVVMMPDNLGFTALHVATRKKRAEIVKELLSFPYINVNALTKDEKTPLDIVDGISKSQESADIRDCLLRYGALPANALNNIQIKERLAMDYKDASKTSVPPLMYRSEEELKMPLSKGVFVNRDKTANPNMTSSSSLSATSAETMVLADSGKRIDEVGRKKYVKKVTGRHNDTYLHLAAQRGDLAAVKQIFDDIDSQMVEADFDTEVAEIRASMVNEVNELGETALYTACEMGHLDVVKELLKCSNKETISKKSRSMYDPLHVAARQGHHAVVQLLLDHDASLCHTRSVSNATPLITAAVWGRTAVVHELLLKGRSLLRIAKSDGKTALHLAARTGHVEIIKTLLEKSPQMARRTDKKGQTALHMAAKGVSCEIVKLLFEANPAVVMLPEKSGFTALHIATRKKRAEIVKILLSFPDISVNALTRDHKTAFDIVDGLPQSEESTEIRECLLSHGAVRAYEMNQQGHSLRNLLTQLKERLSYYESVEDVEI